MQLELDQSKILVWISCLSVFDRARTKGKTAFPFPGLMQYTQGLGTGSIHSAISRPSLQLMYQHFFLFKEV